MIDKDYKKYIKEAADILGVPYYVAAFAYNSCWDFINNKIKNLHEDILTISEDEFNELKTNFTIPNIGKMFTNYNKLNHWKVRLAYINKHNANKLRRDLLEKDLLEEELNEEIEELNVEIDE